MKFFFLIVFIPASLLAQRPVFMLNHDHVKPHEYAEITARLPPTESGNPVTDVLLTGTFISPTNDTTQVEGFCDAPDGRTHRIRFTPTQPGTYRFVVKSYAIHRRRIRNVLTTGQAQTGSYAGTLTATARVDD